MKMIRESFCRLFICLSLIACGANAQTVVDITPNALSATVAGFGSQQIVRSPFRSGVSVRVVDLLGNSVSGTTVTFDIPPTSWSASFSGQRSVTVVTNSSGFATSPIPTPQVNENNPTYDRSFLAVGLFNIIVSTPTVSSPLYKTAVVAIEPFTGSACGAFFSTSPPAPPYMLLTQINENQVLLMTDVTAPDIIAGVDIFDGKEWLLRLPSISTQAIATIPASSRTRNLQARFAGTCLFPSSNSNVLAFFPALSAPQSVSVFNGPELITLTSILLVVFVGVTLRRS